MADSYSGNNMIANVAYDLFTSSTANGSPQYEVMVWLGAFGGAGPISSTGSPIATPTIAGVRWNLWYGSHSNMNVYSFTAPNNMQSYSGDLTAFTRYLSSNHGLPTSQILQSVGAGTEPFTGSNAVFRTSRYSVTVN
jgi:xyloglucan-specific endo-beta-1,4-glucanase